MVKDHVVSVNEKFEQTCVVYRYKEHWKKSSRSSHLRTILIRKYEDLSLIALVKSDSFVIANN